MANETPPPRVDTTLTRHGGLTYLEIPATDPAESAEFYQSVVGWKTDLTDPKHARFSDPTGHLIGRFITTRSANQEPGMIPYIYVDRLADAVAMIAAHGGAVVKPVYPEGNLFVAVIRDPAGNVVGLWQEAEDH
jgi:predicted enzyme related to lactoylglutathione lyase